MCIACVAFGTDAFWNMLRYSSAGLGRILACHRLLGPFETQSIWTGTETHLAIVRALDSGQLTRAPYITDP